MCRFFVVLLIIGFNFIWGITCSNINNPELCNTAYFRMDMFDVILRKMTFLYLEMTIKHIIANGILPRKHAKMHLKVYARA
jgi:hypothetical protein